MMTWKPTPPTTDVCVGPLTQLSATSSTMLLRETFTHIPPATKASISPAPSGCRGSPVPAECPRYSPRPSRRPPAASGTMVRVAEAEHPVPVLTANQPARTVQRHRIVAGRPGVDDRGCGLWPPVCRQGVADIWLECRLRARTACRHLRRLAPAGGADHAHPVVMDRVRVQVAVVPSRAVLLVSATSSVQTAGPPMPVKSATTGCPRRAPPDGGAPVPTARVGKFNVWGRCRDRRGSARRRHEPSR